MEMIPSARISGPTMEALVSASVLKPEQLIRFPPSFHRSMSKLGTFTGIGRNAFRWTDYDEKGCSAVSNRTLSLTMALTHLNARYCLGSGGHSAFAMMMLMA